MLNACSQKFVIDSAGNASKVVGLKAVCLLFIMLFTHNVYAAELCVNVIYPVVQEPYSTILHEIVTGILDVANAPVKTIPLDPQSSPENEGKERVVCRVVIGLGRQGLALAQKSGEQALGGAVLANLGEDFSMPTISMVPDPDVMITRLIHLLGTARTVTVIYNPLVSTEFVRYAKTIASKNGITLRAIQANDMREALVQYQKTLEEMDPKTEALWILQDNSVFNADIILPLVLERAWARQLVVFSSQLAHVYNGALFSVMPDNQKLGRSLGELANQCLQNQCSTDGVKLLTDVRMVVNQKTARRLDIGKNLNTDRMIDLLYPNN